MGSSVKFWVAVVFAVLATPGCRQAYAAETPPPAYVLAAYTAGIPSPVLFSVALQESGMPIRGKLLPWPWTLNVAGKGYRFANRGAACTALLIAIHEAGAKRVDAGLGQVNIGWNGDRFSTPCEALDPHKNLAVAAAILKERYAEYGDWTEAAGRYHHPAGGGPTERYRKAFSAHLKRVLGTTSLLANNP
ncbi:hypothetical protein ALO95_200377 [Pseudomonas syringae pv. antirrhini]|nr:hypothetical protein ALQ23_200368 [Pseudomonas syringae pv. antirrhini]RMW21506.1 hypothetical protein ALO95_200377 [Pseudomonas syringae pv. antirrhini]